MNRGGDDVRAGPVWRKLKICKFSLVSLAKYASLESLSSVLVRFLADDFGARQIAGGGTTCELGPGGENSMFLASKLVRFWEQFPGASCFEQWRLFFVILAKTFSLLS